MTNFVEELRWRGLLHDIMPDTEAHLLEHATAGYIGFDPTADSLHIGSLVQIILLMHLQELKIQIMLLFCMSKLEVLRLKVMPK